jgi:hypothetical protein
VFWSVTAACSKKDSPIAPEKKRSKPGPKDVSPQDVDCRDLLMTAAEELAPEVRPIRALLDACRDDPARFHEEVLGRQLWSKQVAVCKEIARSPVTVVPAGRAVGKSFLMAGTVLWWLYTRPGSLVITTGPDHRQVVSVLWKEIRRALRPRFENGQRISPRLNLGVDHLCPQGFLAGGHGVEVVPEPDARDSRRGIALVAVEHPGDLPGPGVGPVPAVGLARRLHAGERAQR